MDEGMREALETKLGKGELDSRLQKKLEEYHGLISRGAALHLLSLEFFGPQVRASTLLQAKASASAVKLRVRLERVFPARIYDKGGKGGLTQRAAVSDHSGGGTLVCYDDAARPLSECAVSGDLIEVSPVRFRGDEYHVGHGGEIKVAESGPRAKLSGGEGIGTFEGNVSEFFGDFPYRKNRGEGGLMSAFELDDGKGKARCVLWDSPGMKNSLSKGMKAIIENGVRRGEEIHIGAAGRLLFARKNPDEGRPVIEKIEIDEERGKVVARAGSISAEMTFDEACKNLGIGPVPEGIKPVTLLNLKKGSWIGRHMPKSWEKN